MIDKIFEELVKKTSVSIALVNDVTVKLSDDELSVLKRKADRLGMSVEDLMRVYLVNTTAFDKSFFEGKKPSRKTPKNEVKTSEDINIRIIDEQ